MQNKKYSDIGENKPNRHPKKIVSKIKKNKLLKKLLFTALFCATTFAFAGNDNLTKYTAEKSIYSPNDTCVITFTAYYSDGSTYSWTETYYSFGYSSCQGIMNARLEELNKN